MFISLPTGSQHSTIWMSIAVVSLLVSLLVRVCLIDNKVSILDHVYATIDH